MAEPSVFLKYIEIQIVVIELIDIYSCIYHCFFLITYLFWKYLIALFLNEKFIWNY